MFAHKFKQRNKRLQARKGSAPNAAQSLANIEALYLPTEDHYLMPSCEVFVNDTMEKKERLKDYWKELLIDLTMTYQEPPAKLVELLPNHLKVSKLSSKLNEELSPSCSDKICILDQDLSASSCDFIERYRDIICSRQFSEALLRLYKVQEAKGQIPEQAVKMIFEALRTGLKFHACRQLKCSLSQVPTVNQIPGSVKKFLLSAKDVLMDA